MVFPLVVCRFLLFVPRYQAVKKPSLLQPVFFILPSGEANYNSFPLFILKSIPAFYKFLHFLQIFIDFFALKRYVFK